jgi:hypothetical protein
MSKIQYEIRQLEFQEQLIPTNLSITCVTSDAASIGAPLEASGHSHLTTYQTKSRIWIGVPYNAHELAHLLKALDAHV